MTTQTTSVKVYLVTFVSLLLLLALTVAVSYLSLGRFNTVIALLIAVAKMFLVMLFFMHLRHGSRLVWIYAGAGFFWLGILLALTMSDFLTRWWPPFAGR